MSSNNSNFFRKIEIIKERPEVALDALHLLLGDFIGTGAYRDVYEYGMDNTWVVKIQRDRDNHNNLIEYNIWNDICYTDYKKWFAECGWISDNGLVMLQKKVTPIHKDNGELARKVPEKIPYFFTDIKPDNFGWIGKQLVCHDYDYSLSKFVANGLHPRMISSKKITSYR